MTLAGPLSGLRVLELGGIGPAPFAGMWLADMGADVVRVDRKTHGPLPVDPTRDVLNRNKRSIMLDLKAPEAIRILLDRMPHLDIVIEGFRPGVVERLGIGPDECLVANPALVYGRMTGWGQSGPLAQTAGHDINYIALTGALAAIGDKDGPPQIPLNLLGDFGGGATYLIMGVLAGVLSARATGRGQVVDTAIVDGVTHLLSGTHTMLNSGIWKPSRASNYLDGGAPFYSIYETADGGFMAVGAIEPQFFAALVVGLSVEIDVNTQLDEATWPETRAKIADAFRSRTRAEWTATFADRDACVTPVLSFEEANDDPHIMSRSSLVETEYGVQAWPAPRFSATPAALTPRSPAPGDDTLDVLREWGHAPLGE